MNQVTLLDGMFKQSEQLGKQYLLDLDVDRLVAPCYEAAGQQAKNKRYGGWESTQISGHSIGHWLSAAAAMVKATGDEQLKKKLDYAVDELAHVQSFDPDGYVSGFPRRCFDEVFSGQFEVAHFNLAGSWVPWYSIHKIYAGLIDTYNLTGNEKALDVVVKLADWAKKGTDNLDDEQFERMLICEFGGMNEAMADLYTMTGNRDYLDLAIRFCQRLILDPLSQGIDELEGKHANTQIPKVIGAAKLYNITGESYYKDIALFFWHQVVEHRSYVFGGNSNREHFGPEGTEELGIMSAETCNTYNMMKLTQLLYEWDPQAKYMDFYERALYNHILASQDPDSGMKMYFIPTEPGHFKIYSTPDNSFWCCVGTGMENPARYTHGIYQLREHDLYVNLFIASQLNGERVQVKQETTFPETNESRLVIERCDADFRHLHIRVPYWLDGEMAVAVNGEAITVEPQDGYVTIARPWQAGDEVVVTLPMGLHMYEAKDESNHVAFMYGPIVLAGALGRENYPESDILADHLSLNNHPLIDVPTLVSEERDCRTFIKPVEGEALTFRIDGIGQPGDVSVTLVPFYKLHHERYVIYWTLLDERAYEESLQQAEDEMARLNRMTVDGVQPGEQQPEVEHGVQMHQSQTGYSHIVRRPWRNSRGAGGFFSYRLAVDSEAEQVLHVTYCLIQDHVHDAGIWYERRFDILIDGTKIAEETLRQKPHDVLFDVKYELPLSLTKGKQQVEVKFTSAERTMAGPVYDVRILDESRLK